MAPDPPYLEYRRFQTILAIRAAELADTIDRQGFIAPKGRVISVTVKNGIIVDDLIETCDYGAGLLDNLWLRLGGFLEDIEIRQSNRFYFWRVKQFPIPRKEIQQNSANMHMIPADEDIEKRLKKIRKGHLVRFTGYLVRVDSRDNWFWKSSLTRKDTGSGACERVWVEELELS